MRWFVLPFFAAAACGSSGSGSSPPEQKQPPHEVIQPKPLEPITGAHGGSINTLAITSDGLAAVSGDTTGGLRLWPALDGSREPIVIKAAPASSLAIAIDGAGFAIAVTDSADQVELIRVDSRGHVKSRRKLGEAHQVEVVGESLLVFRSDQAIEHIAFDGTLKARLLPDAGTRIQSLVVRDSTVMAILSGEKQTHARVIDLGPLSWGETSAALALADGTAAVITSDGEALVAQAAKDNRISRFDLKTGKAKVACPEPVQQFGRFRRFDGFDGFAADAPIGVIGDKVICIVNGTVSWFDLEKGSTTTSQVGSSPGVFAAATNKIVFASEHQLVIHAEEKTEYLGYGFRDLTHVRSVPTGLMIGKGDQEPVLLDENFRERARFSLPKLRVDWTDLIPVDDRYVLASSTRPGGGDMWGSAYQIAIYDTVKQVMHQVLPHRARNGELAYEPTTQLLVASDGNKTLLMRYDRDTHSLGNEITLDLPEIPKQVALLDPKQSGGVIAISIRDENGGLVVSEFHVSDVPPSQELDGKYVVRMMRAKKTYRIAGELRAIDRAGKLYVHGAMYPETIGIYVGGVSKAQLDGAQSGRLRPSPDGKKAIQVVDGKLVLFVTDGTRVWETAAWGSSDVDWTPDGMLFGRFPHALARIDLKTGALAERQCGWAFGISTTPRDGSTQSPSVCDVAP